MIISQKTKSKLGFTLMEVVIVIAVIAILAAVAIPVFTSSLNSSEASMDDGWEKLNEAGTTTARASLATDAEQTIANPTLAEIDESTSTTSSTTASGGGGGTVTTVINGTTKPSMPSTAAGAKTPDGAIQIKGFGSSGTANVDSFKDAFANVLYKTEVKAGKDLYTRDSFSRPTLTLQADVYEDVEIPSSIVIKENGDVVNNYAYPTIELNGHNIYGSITNLDSRIDIINSNPSKGGYIGGNDVDVAFTNRGIIGNIKNVTFIGNKYGVAHYGGCMNVNTSGIGGFYNCKIVGGNELYGCGLYFKAANGGNLRSIENCTIFGYYGIHINSNLVKCINNNITGVCAGIYQQGSTLGEIQGGSVSGELYGILAQGTINLIKNNDGGELKVKGGFAAICVAGRGIVNTIKSGTFVANGYKGDVTGNQQIGIGLWSHNNGRVISIEGGTFVGRGEKGGYGAYSNAKFPTDKITAGKICADANKSISGGVFLGSTRGISASTARLSGGSYNKYVNGNASIVSGKSAKAAADYPYDGVTYYEMKTIS